MTVSLQRRNELQQMQQQADKNKIELQACEKEVAEMEKKIQQYKEQRPRRNA